MTLTQAERDWLAALWRQAERDAAQQGRYDWFEADWPDLGTNRTEIGRFWPTRPPLSW